MVRMVASRGRIGDHREREETYENPGFIAACARGSRQPPRRPQAQTNRPEVNVRSFHESSFRQKGTLCPVDQLPLKALIKVLIRFYRLSLSFSLDRWWFLCCSRPTAKTPEFSRFCLLFFCLLPPLPEKIRETNVCFRVVRRETFEADTAGWVLESCLEKLDSS